jgi:hypothetical protein
MVLCFIWDCFMVKKAENPIYVSSEEAEQIAVIQYCDLLGIPVIHAANEGKRSYAYGAKLKRMGLRPGFPDLLITRARGGYHGFAIEMKYGKNKTTSDQVEWLRRLSAEKYATAVCYSASEAIRLIEKYESLKEGK